MLDMLGVLMGIVVSMLGGLVLAGVAGFFGEVFAAAEVRNHIVIIEPKIKPTEEEIIKNALLEVWQNVEVQVGRTKEASH